MRIFSIAMVLLFVVSCSSSTDITKNHAAMTDFVVDQIYLLKKPAWIREQTLLTLRGKEPTDSKGIVTAGTRLAVRKIVMERSPEIGTYTDVFAEVLTGDYKGKIVNIGVISQVLKTGYTKRDPEMLEPVEDATK